MTQLQNDALKGWKGLKWLPVHLSMHRTLIHTQGTALCVAFGLRSPKATQLTNDICGVSNAPRWLQTSIPKVWWPRYFAYYSATLLEFNRCIENICSDICHISRPLVAGLAVLHTQKLQGKIFDTGQIENVLILGGSPLIGQLRRDSPWREINANK